MLKTNLYLRILHLIVLLVFSTLCTGIANTETLESAFQQALKNPETSKEFNETYKAEMIQVHTHPNLPADISINYVWVLSGRNSYLKEPVDHPDVNDPVDDYNRLELGIKIAQDVAKLRANKSDMALKDYKKYGPMIIYNGRPKHNHDLKKALAEGILNHYPADKFKIMDLDPQQINTKGQFMDFKKYFPNLTGDVAIVTHAYHFPRVARMLGSPLNPFAPEVKVTFYLVDRNLDAPGAKEDLVGEMNRIPRYIQKGDLGVHIPNSINY